MLVDQSLEARVFPQGVPCRIELKHWDVETVWDNEQMIEQPKCFIELYGRSINLGERGGTLRPIECVLGFRSQFNCAFAIGDRFLILTHCRKEEAILPVQR